MPNENIMGIPTKACVNGVTKEETERLKNALIKKIEDNETTVNVTEDGKVIVADNSGFYLSYDGNLIGIEQDISGDYIPKTVPYLPEDANENPLAPPNDTIMTSANIAVDPRIVHTTGNENISGTKTFQGTAVLSGGFSTGWYVGYGTTVTADNGKWIRGIYIDLSHIRRNNNSNWEALLFITTTDVQNLFNTDVGIIRIAIRGQSSTNSIVGSAKWLCGIGADADFIFTWENGDGWMYYKKRHQYKNPLVVRMFERTGTLISAQRMRILTEEERTTAVFTDEPVTDEANNIYAFKVDALQ